MVSDRKKKRPATSAAVDLDLKPSPDESGDGEPSAKKTKKAAVVKKPAKAVGKKKSKKDKDGAVPVEGINIIVQNKSLSIHIYYIFFKWLAEYHMLLMLFLF